MRRDDVRRRQEALFAGLRLQLRDAEDEETIKNIWIKALGARCDGEITPEHLAALRGLVSEKGGRP